MDELRLVYGADVSLLAGDDINRNGVLDANETDTTGMGELNSGLFEYTTVWTREPNFHADGSSLTNVNSTATGTEQKIQALLQERRRRQRHHHGHADLSQHSSRRAQAG